MRIWTLPAVAVGVFAVTGLSDEPSEAAMRSAFQATLKVDVRAALDFVAETGGEAALARVRAARTDAFEIRNFTKLGCIPSPRADGYVCGFTVRIAVAPGEINRVLAGRFYQGPRGLAFDEDVPAPAGA
jgi:hypothetical protein